MLLKMCCGNQSVEQFLTHIECSRLRKEDFVCNDAGGGLKYESDRCGKEMKMICGGTGMG